MRRRETPDIMRADSVQGVTREGIIVLWLRISPDAILMCVRFPILIDREC